jgi:hypothetical protein
MEKNLVLDNVISSVTLEDKEGYVVDFNGALVTSAGTGCLGAIHEGRPAGEANVAVISGIYDVYVDGATANISVNDPLTAGGGATAGEMTKATIGTHPVRAYAREAATTNKKISVMFV